MYKLSNSKIIVQIPFFLLWFHIFNLYNVEIFPFEFSTVSIIIIRYRSNSGPWVNPISIFKKKKNA